jgi:hypothetical protein
VGVVYCCDEAYVSHVLPMCQVFGDLQQQPWKEEVAAHVQCIFGCAPRVPSHDFYGETPRLAFIGCT